MRRSCAATRSGSTSPKRSRTASATTRRRAHRSHQETDILGIFDSGLGGLTVLRSVRARLPREDVVYLADQAHVPYGDRTEDDLVRLLTANLAALDREGVDAVVMGCNTSCAVASRRGWPEHRAPVLDLIEAAAADVVARTAARKIGVIATVATARSGAYGRAIRMLAPHAEVIEVGAPALVPLVEAGHLAGPDVDAAVAAACATLPEDLDAVVLACTHYPLVDESFAKALGPAVLRLDPAVAQAERALAYARGGERGRTGFLTTGPLEPYRAALEAICGPLAPGDDVAAASVLLRSG